MVNRPKESEVLPAEPIEEIPSEIVGEIPSEDNNEIPSEDSNSNNNDNSEEVIPFQPVSIQLIASRDYKPNLFNSFNGTISVGGNYKLPDSFEVVTGNSGQGFLTLQVGNYKYCYVGNASGKSTGDGTKFILTTQKNSVDDDCTRSKGDIEVVKVVDVIDGDLILVNVEGGNCGKECLYTEVEASLVSQE